MQGKFEDQKQESFTTNQLPLEFLAIRGKITEIPGFVQERVNVQGHKTETRSSYNEAFSTTRKLDEFPEYVPKQDSGTTWDLRRGPQEFSSVRGKSTENPARAQERSKFHYHKRESHATDIFSWFRGFVSTIMGKETGGLEVGTRDHSSVSDGIKDSMTDTTRAMLHDQSNVAGLAKSFEIGALRRLQRETFSDLLKVRERLDKLEHQLGLWRGKSSRDVSSGLKTTLKGRVNSGGAFVLVEDLTSHLSRFALQHAGMLTGLNVRFTFETPLREDDLLTTQCGVGQISGESYSGILGGPISLQKINYTAQINDTLSLAVAPLGAEAADMSDTVNHLQGQALTTFAGRGPALYQNCRGSAVGACLKSSSVLLSMSQFLSGWGSSAADSLCNPLCLSTLAQCMVQPWDHIVFSLSAVNNLWPNLNLASRRGSHWSEMGPFVLCRTVTRPTQPTGTFTFHDMPTSSGTSFLSQGNIRLRDSWIPDVESRSSDGTTMQSVAFSGEVDLGGHMSLGGWAQLDRADWLEELENFQWNVSLAKSTRQNVNWGLSLGRRKREGWGEDGALSPTSGPLEYLSSQLQMECFINLEVGRGFTLQPGFVHIIDKYTQTPTFMVRSSWTL